MDERATPMIPSTVSGVIEGQVSERMTGIRKSYKDILFKV